MNFPCGFQPLQMLNNISQISRLREGERLGMPILGHLYVIPVTQATLLMTDKLQSSST